MQHSYSRMSYVIAEAHRESGAKTGKQECLYVRTHMKHTCKYAMGSRGTVKLLRSCKEHAVAVWTTTLRAVNL